MKQKYVHIKLWITPKQKRAIIGKKVSASEIVRTLLDQYLEEK